MKINQKINIMQRKTLSKETIRKFVAEINENGNTGANFIDYAALNNFLVSDLGAVFKENENFVWIINNVGKLIERKGGLLILEEDKF